MVLAGMLKLWADIKCTFWGMCVWVWVALSAEKGEAAARQLELQAYLHKNKEQRSESWLEGPLDLWEDDTRRDIL